MTTPVTFDSFLLPRHMLASRRNVKWSSYHADIIPAWIAETDYRTAPPVLAAIERIVTEEDFGYPRRQGGAGETALKEAFAGKMLADFGWRISPTEVQVVTDVVQGVMASVMAFSAEGDRVIVHTPSYPPFREVVEAAGRTFAAHPLGAAGDGFRPDLDRLEADAKAGARILALCNPHNPTGYVFSREELETILDIAARHGMTVVSDEIHCDILYDDARHIPIASLDKASGVDIVTLNSPTKSFNIAGLRCAIMHFNSAGLKDRFLRRVPARLLGRAGIVGIDASTAAWTQGQDWLRSEIAYFHRMRDSLHGAVSAIDGLSMHKPRSTYFGWIDCSALALNEPAASHFEREAGIAFSPGESFAADHGNWVRCNFATSESILDEITQRLGAAVKRL